MAVDRGTAEKYGDYVHAFSTSREVILVYSSNGEDIVEMAGGDPSEQVPAEVVEDFCEMTDVDGFMIERGEDDIEVVICNVDVLEDDGPLARSASSDGAAVFLVNDRNEVLLLKRGMTAPWMPGKWNLPGGAVDPGETPIEAAVRETQEEASVTPRGLSVLSVTHHDWGTLHLYVSRRWTGDLKMTWESSDMRWVPIKEAVEFDLVPGILEPMIELEKLLR